MTAKIKTNSPLLSDRAKITQTIANFWNQISEGWRMVWGPHIHHGYYENNNVLSPLEAQEKLIEKLAEIVDIMPHTKILDAGCGMGGSSLYLAKKYQATVIGITLSDKQVAIATQQAKLENIKHVTFQIEDALSLASFSDNSFDVIWSLESCEQFYDKNLFIKQAFRVLKPNGKLLLATWCSDRDEYEGQLAKKYKKLCQAFDLPYMPSIERYRVLLEKQNFIVKEICDWSTKVAKSWDIGVSLVSAYSFLKILKIAGWRGFRFAKQIKLMQEAFHQQWVRYGVFLAVKPDVILK